MGASKDPVIDEIAELLDRHTNAEIGRMMRAKGYDIAPARIRNARYNRGGAVHSVTPRAYLPPEWEIQRRHWNQVHVSRLRDLERRREKLPLTPRRRIALENWLKTLAQDDLVIHYDKIVGFHTVPRRRHQVVPGVWENIDHEWIKDPTRADDGSKINRWIPPEK